MKDIKISHIDRNFEPIKVEFVLENEGELNELCDLLGKGQLFFTLYTILHNVRRGTCPSRFLF